MPNNKDATTLIGELTKDLDIAKEHVEIVLAQYNYLYSQVQKIADSIGAGDIRAIPSAMPTLGPGGSSGPSGSGAPLAPQFASAPLTQRTSLAPQQVPQQVYSDGRGGFCIMDQYGRPIPCDHNGYPIPGRNIGHASFAPSPMLKKTAI